MEKQEVIEFIKNNPVFYLATIKDNTPKVRGMLLYSVDNEGIIFHTYIKKNIYKEIMANNLAEACFNCNKKGQVRVSGKVIEIKDKNLKDEILNHPTRGFLRDWNNKGYINDFYNELIVFKLKFEEVTLWTLDTNFQECEKINMN